jgi:peroxin-14
MIEKSKDAEKQTLAELQQELKSLKALLLSRSSGLPSAPASPAPTLPYGIGRPTIPAWQLAPTASESGAPSATPRPALDKGKAPERPTSTEIPP